MKFHDGFERAQKSLQKRGYAPPAEEAEQFLNACVSRHVHSNMKRVKGHVVNVLHSNAFPSLRAYFVDGKLFCVFRKVKGDNTPHHIAENMID